MSGSLISTVRQNLHDTSDLETLLYQQFQLASMDVETRNEAQTTMMNILAGKLPVPVAVAANCARRAADPSSVASSSSSSHYAQRKTVYSSNSLLAMKVLLSRENIAVETQIVDRGDSGSSSGSSSSSSSGRYKTELCRPFEESGQCKYGEKCQFAHGAKELRSLPRHPKYKTDLCRTYHTIGFCPYGPRCHFIHNEDERRLGCIVNKNQQQQQQQQPTPIHRPKWSNLKRLSSLGSSLDSPRSSDSGSPTRLSPTFSEDIFTSSSSSSSSSLPSYPALLINSSSSDDSSSRSSPDLTSSQQQQQQQNLTSPLNVHTHLNTVDTVLDLLRLQQQFNQVLSFAEQNYCSNNNQQQAMVVEDNFLFRNIYPSCASSTSPGSVESSQNSTYGSSSTPSNTLSLNWIH